MPEHLERREYDEYIDNQQDGFDGGFGVGEADGDGRWIHGYRSAFAEFFVPAMLFEGSFESGIPESIAISRGVDMISGEILFAMQAEGVIRCVGIEININEATFLGTAQSEISDLFGAPGEEDGERKTEIGYRTEIRRCD